MASPPITSDGRNGITPKELAYYNNEIAKGSGSPLITRLAEKATQAGVLLTPLELKNPQISKFLKANEDSTMALRALEKGWDVISRDRNDIYADIKIDPQSQLVTSGTYTLRVREQNYALFSCERSQTNSPYGITVFSDPQDPYNYKKQLLDDNAACPDAKPQTVKTLYASEKERRIARLQSRIRELSQPLAEARAQKPKIQERIDQIQEALKPGGFYDQFASLHSNIPFNLIDRYLELSREIDQIETQLLEEFSDPVQSIETFRIRHPEIVQQVLATDSRSSPWDQLLHVAEKAKRDDLIDSEARALLKLNVEKLNQKKKEIEGLKAATPKLVEVDALYHKLPTYLIPGSIRINLRGERVVVYSTKMRPLTDAEAKIGLRATLDPLKAQEQAEIDQRIRRLEREIQARENEIKSLK